MAAALRVLRKKSCCGCSAVGGGPRDCSHSNFFFADCVWLQRGGWGDPRTAAILFSRTALACSAVGGGTPELQPQGIPGHPRDPHETPPGPHGALPPILIIPQTVLALWGSQFVLSRQPWHASLAGAAGIPAGIPVTAGIRALHKKLATKLAIINKACQSKACNA